jgi:uncharacterized protein YqeY
MGLKDQIESDLKVAMKARDRETLAALRMLKSKIQEQEVALRGKESKDAQLGEEAVQAVISAYAKQRRDSIDSYEKGGREELAAKERAELKLITAYLPKQLTDDEISAIVERAVTDSGAESMKDIGAVMKLVMPQVKGLADGKKVNEIVRQKIPS